MRQDGKTFVWYDAEGQGRNLYAEFRRSFNLSGKPEKAEFSLFADTVYQLNVNGKFVGFGPVRFDPRFPVYDTYDIAQYLEDGENVISVVVNHFGSKTYKSIIAKAGFCSWGTVDGIDLSTSVPGWKCKPSKARQAYMPKISFALNQAEIFMQGYEEKGWKNPGFDDSAWPDAVALSDQNAWGEFKGRNIPFMSLEDIKIENEAKILPIQNDEDIFAFECPLPKFYDDDKDDYSFFIAFSTWIWSPCKQTVNVGTFWGELWLNGKEIPSGMVDPHKNMRINQLWDLEEGWNYLFGKVGGYSDYLYQMYAVPKTAGLVFSADKDKNSSKVFRHTTMMDKKLFEDTLAKMTLPYSPDEKLEAIGGWKYAEKDAMNSAPNRYASWDNYGNSFETMDINQKGKVFRKDLYPQGFSILIDLDYTRLVFPVISLSGVEGAIVDITHSERVLPDNQHLKFEFNYLSGDRVYCSEDKLDFMNIQPRGMRYMMITVRGAKGDVTFNSLRILDAAFPVEDIGSFECSDQLLNNIWKACRLTQQTNMEDAYVDCVGRERGMYIRDTIIQYFNNLAVFGDHSLMERCMQLYGQSPDPSGKYRAVYPNSGTYTIADFCLNAIEGYYALYKYTGDTSAIVRDWDNMTGNLNWFNELADEREDKLLDAEWDKNRGIYANYGGFHGDLGIAKGLVDNTGIHCTFSCTYLVAINNMIEMAEAIGKLDEAKQLKERAATVRESIRSAFYNEEKGAYRDNLTTDIHSFHSNIMAIRAGVVTEEQLPRIKEFIRNNLKSMFLNGYGPEDGVHFSPSYSFYILEGLYQAGLYDVAEMLIKSGWGYFLYIGLKQIPEYYNMKGGQSLCHAWSASPIYFLSTALSGVTYPELGNLNKVDIQVKTANVQWAKVKIPHLKGVIEVKWHKENDEIVYDKVSVPDGVEVNIIK